MSAAREVGQVEGVEIGRATAADIDGILALQEANLAERGGMLSDAYSRARLAAAMVEMPVIVARRGTRVVGYVMSGTRESKVGVPIMEAMLRAYPGSAGAYMYGPICVAESERRRGIASALFAALCAALPERESLTFVRSDNAASLQAHAAFGMRPVAAFEFGGVESTILSYRP